MTTKHDKATRMTFLCKACGSLMRGHDCDEMICENCGACDWSPRTFKGAAMSTHNKATPRPWQHACDSYGKVQHSRKACVFASVEGEGGQRLITVAGRIENWKDAALIVEAVNAYDAVRELVEAAQALVTECTTDKGPGVGVRMPNRVAVDALRAALAKVKGA